jgi:acetylornithine/succinyldiaminopimelate/putrescine aminotransferase
VRGEGLLLGLDLGPELAPKVFERCLKEGVLFNIIGGTTIRLAPPLTVTRTEIRHALDTLRTAVDTLTGAPSGVPFGVPAAAARLQAAAVA